ncbi:MAG: fibronectin type III domain-containing protein [Candidatus Paceibacterota bacterium]
MTTASSSVYTYSYTANTANGSTYIDGTVTVSLSATADAAGNSSGSPTNNTFLIDTTGPIVVISAVCSIEGNGCTAEGISASPQESYMVRTISGTASDGGGVGSIDISIKDVSTNAWYNGSSFTDISETYRAATGTTTWSYNTTAVPFVINHVYTVNIRATDQASNVQIQSGTFKFTNAPPVVSNVSASQDQSGAVRVLYDVSDIESSQTTNYLFYSVGATLSTGITSNITTITVSDATYFPNSGTILIDDEIISYTSKTGNVLGGMTRGALATTPTTHTGGSSVLIQAITTSGTGLSDEGTGKLITWTTPTDITGYDSASQLIKVVANDGASGSMIGSASPAVFTLDVKSPEIADADFYIDASVSTSSTAGVKLFATDLSQMQYRLCLNADFSADNLNTGLGSCTTWSATSTAVDLTPELNLIYTATSTGEQAVSVQVRDVYGNTISKTKTTPVMPVSFLYKDVSNLGATPPTYREYLDWATTDESNFLRYEVWFSSSLNSTYTLLTNVSNRVNSFYTHNILTNTDATYNYKIRTIGTHGDISRFTTVASDVPNGVGGTGGDNTPPVITLTGASPFSVTVGGTYTEPGVSAVDETDGAVEVTSSGTVNTAAVGSYVITYVAHDTSNNIATRTRTVNVVLAPTYNITATAGAHGSISPNGVTAVNSGTSQVYTITPDENYIVGSLTVDGVSLVPATEYTFTNVAGIHTIEATFVLENIIPPVVTIVGDNPMNVNTGTTFVDPGVTAYESDGSTLITDSTKIVRSIATADGTRLSSVSTATGASGIIITYTVTGADGGIAVTTRTVNVIDVTPPVISDIATPIITSDSVAIVWKTNEVSNSQISYSTTAGSYTQNSTLNINLVLNHLVALTDLTPDTTYYYVIKSTDGIGNTVTSEEQSFSTIKIKETIIFSGGGGGSGGVLQSVYDALLEENEANKAKVKLQETDAPIISNVGISNITAFSATVSFDTNKNTIAFIKYGKDTTYTNTAGDDSFKTNHSIVLRGLTMGTEYHVKVSVSDRFSNTSSSEDKTFKTQFLTENIAELKKIENVEQFQNEIESTIESILPSLVPPFIDKPIVSDITENGATVTFRTNIKAYPVVSYAPQNTYDATKENPYDAEVSDTAMKNMVHSVKLTGLKSNTRYHLMAKAFSLPQVVGKSEDITFTTAASKIRASVTDVKKDSFVVIWNTDELTSSIVEYRNVKTGINARITNEIKNYSHSVKVENLLPGTLYKVSVSGINANGNYVEGISELNVKTSTDNTPPTVSNVKVSSAFIAGRTDRVQTIVSWQTDEPATSAFYFEEGSGSTSKKPANKQEDLELTKNHVVIIMTLKPGTVYRFMVSSTDDANNTFSSPVRTIVTPQKSESIVDVIFKNFDDTFNFIKNVR